MLLKSYQKTRCCFSFFFLCENYSKHVGVGLPSLSKHVGKFRLSLISFDRPTCCSIGFFVDSTAIIPEFVCIGGFNSPVVLTCEYFDYFVMVCGLLVLLYEMYKIVCIYLIIPIEKSYVCVKRKHSTFHQVL